MGGKYPQDNSGHYLQLTNKGDPEIPEMITVKLLNLRFRQAGQKQAQKGRAWPPEIVQVGSPKMMTNGCWSLAPTGCPDHLEISYRFLAR